MKGIAMLDKLNVPASIDKQTYAKLLALDKLMGKNDDETKEMDLSKSILSTIDYCSTFIPSVMSWGIDKKRSLSERQLGAIAKIYKQFDEADWFDEESCYECFIDDARIRHVQ